MQDNTDEGAGVEMAEWDMMTDAERIVHLEGVIETGKQNARRSAEQYREKLEQVRRDWIDICAYTVDNVRNMNVTDKARRICRDGVKDLHTKTADDLLPAVMHVRELRRMEEER